jgi:hypothetical protein
MVSGTCAEPQQRYTYNLYITGRYGYGPTIGPLNWFVAGATTLYNQYGRRYFEIARGYIGVSRCISHCLAGTYGMLYDMSVPVSVKSAAVDAVRLERDTLL